MKKIILKGIEPTNFIKFVVKTSRLRDKKGDKIMADSFPLYLSGTQLKSMKQNGTKTTVKYWTEDLSAFCENADEIKEQLGDEECRIWIFSCKDLVTSGLKRFKGKVDLEIQLNGSNDAVDYVTLIGGKTKILFTVADANKFFVDNTGGQKAIDDFFDVSEASVTFELSAKDIKKIKALSKTETRKDKLHESISLDAKDGWLNFVSNSSSDGLYETDIKMNRINLKRDNIETICEEHHNVYAKVFNGIDFLILKSTETKTIQSILMLTEHNSTIELSDVEEEIEAIDYSDWTQDADGEEPLF